MRSYLQPLCRAVGPVTWRTSAEFARFVRSRVNARTSVPFTSTIEADPPQALSTGVKVSCIESVSGLSGRVKAIEMFGSCRLLELAGASSVGVAVPESIVIGVLVAKDAGSRLVTASTA